MIKLRRLTQASKMLATEWKKFSTRRSISGVFAQAITGGNASEFSDPGTDTTSGIAPPVF